MFSLYYHYFRLIFFLITFFLVHSKNYAIKNKHKIKMMNCHYDPNDIETFTLDAIKSYDSLLAYTWDNEDKLAYFMYEKDTIILQIGGCDVFNYNIAYRTADVENFSNEEFITEKVSWMTSNFFSSGFDIKFWEAIRDGQYILDTVNSNSTSKLYLLDNIDTTIQTNQVFRGFGVRKVGSGIEIWASGYFD